LHGIGMVSRGGGNNGSSAARHQHTDRTTTMDGDSSPYGIAIRLYRALFSSPRRARVANNA